MVKKTFVLTSLLLSGLTYANDYQGKTTEPIGSLHPVEMVCKAALPYVNMYDLRIPQGYVVVGETHDAICPGGGKNAWLTKVLESGDTICAATHQMALTQNIYHYDTFDWRGYDVIDKGYSPHCPENYTFTTPITRTATNTATVQAIELSSPHCAWKDNNAYVIGRMVYKYGNSGESCAAGDRPYSFYYKNTLSTEEISCYPSYSGYVSTNWRYSKDCDPTRDFRETGPYPLYAFTQIIPKRGVTYEVSNHQRLVLGWVMTKSIFIEGAIPPWRYAGLKPTANTLNVCMVSNTTPHDYRVIGFGNIAECGSGSGKDYPNYVQIKKLTDQEEVFCLLGVDGASMRFNTNVPNSYIVVDKFHAPQCNTPSLEGHINAYKIRKLNPIDSICKMYLREGERTQNMVSLPFYGEDDYGIIGETTLENCSTETNNAWVIKKLAETDTVCQAGFQYQYYPDYVIDSVAHLPSCPGTGNNAYNLRHLNEPEDLICLHPNDGGNFYYSFNSRGYDASYDTKAACGTLRAASIRLR